MIIDWCQVKRGIGSKRSINTSQSAEKLASAAALAMLGLVERLGQPSSPEDDRALVSMHGDGMTLMCENQKFEY